MKRIVIQFACTAKEKRAIQRAAKRGKVTVSEWLRDVASEGILRQDKIDALSAWMDGQERPIAR